MNENKENGVDPEMRIVSLLPSTTEIVFDLGLGANLVGVTHECDLHELEKICGKKEEDVVRVTTTVMPPEVFASQRLIDDAVKQSITDGISLYTVEPDRLQRANPTIILTQTLCDVCAPAYDAVTSLCAKLFRTPLSDNAEALPVTIVSLEPTSVEAVVDTFLTVADACGVHERGIAVQDLFHSRIQRLEDTVQRIRSTSFPESPSIVLLEWLDPYFDGGHWIPDMTRSAGCRAPEQFDGTRRRSEERSMEELLEADPEVIVVACCGFDLRRNYNDTIAHVEDTSRQFRSLSAVRSGRLFALDADRFFARPSPSLAAGAAIMARCAHDQDPHAVELLESSLADFLPPEGDGWIRIDPALAQANGAGSTNGPTSAAATDGSTSAGTPNGTATTNGMKATKACVGHVEIEDAAVGNWWKAHDEAVREGKAFYKDPKMGFKVFTQLAHKTRGHCCGSGCRHCPYGHDNIAPGARADRIQQPAFLHKRKKRSEGVRDNPRDVVFFSTGKDSLLALRRWIADQLRQGREEAEVLDRLVLLTTFDANSRRIAHQDTSIRDAQKQAEHLDLDLLAVPLHPGIEYIDQLTAGIDHLRSGDDDEHRTKLRLVFGDLHLEEIRDWRETELGHLGQMEYPIFGVDYQDLVEDLDASGVPCVITSCSFGHEFQEKPCPEVKNDRLFDPALRSACRASGWDAFGENGEFHTLAQVWAVPARRALGLP